jgi:activating signal cointegrator 1
VKALPLWQPWATLVAVGAKRVETRSWPAPAYLWGQRIAIHATKGGLSKRDEEELLARPGFAQALGAEASMLPRGAIVATCLLARSTRITAGAAAQLEQRNPREFAFGDYTPGRFAWVLQDVRALDDPFPCRGHQGLFDAPKEVVKLAEGGQAPLFA